jgi:hypothetical protein
MLFRMTIKPAVYQKMRKLYGKHVEAIHVYTRPVKDAPGKFGYSATCDTHGVITAWVGNIDTRSLRVLEHLKGLHD